MAQQNPKSAALINQFFIGRRIAQPEQLDSGLQMASVLCPTAYPLSYMYMVRCSVIVNVAPKSHCSPPARER